MAIFKDLGCEGDDIQVLAYLRVRVFEDKSV